MDEQLPKAKWTHSAENKAYSESWRLLNVGHVPRECLALVTRDNGPFFSAWIYPLGKLRKLGDVYRSSEGARATCVRHLRKAGLIR